MQNDREKNPFDMKHFMTSSKHCGYIGHDSAVARPNLANAKFLIFQFAFDIDIN